MPDTDIKSSEGEGNTSQNNQSKSDKDERMHWSAPPRLPVFSGDEKDTPFELWQFEIQCLQGEGRDEMDVRAAIRRSLKGKASRTLMTLGVNASVSMILDKFSSVFGPTETAQTVLSRFYSLRQKECEDAGSFAARLEDCIRQASSLGRIEEGDIETMLREAFEGGLALNTRKATSYLFQSNSRFDKLVLQVKTKEKELELIGKPAVRSLEQTEIENLRATVAELKTEVKQLRDSNQPPNRGSPILGRGQPYARSLPTQTFTPRFVHNQPSRFVQPQTFSHTRLPHDRSTYQNQNTFKEIVCFRCGLVGHVQKGCRANLNSNRSVRQGSSPALR